MTTLSRLSFWLPAEQMTRFEAAYRKRLSPLLGQRELVEFSAPMTSSIEGVFSRLFEVAGPADISATEQTLLSDPAWQEALRGVATSLDLPATGITCRLRLFSTTAPSFEATPAGIGFRHGLWRSFNRLDGMSLANTNAILQDSGGHIWFAGGGLCRYDGSRFYTWDTTGLSSHSVLAMAEDTEGRKWFGTGNWLYGSARDEGSGVLCLDGESWRLFSTEDGLPGEVVRSVAVDRDGRVWFGTDAGVSHCEGSAFRNHTEADGLCSNSVNVVFPDSNGDLWFGTKDGVSRYDGREFTTLRTTDRLVDDNVTAIARDGDGGMWFATPRGVSRYRGGDFNSFTSKTGLVHDHVTAIAVDGDGRVWLGTLGGVSCYDGDSFSTFTIHEGLVHNVVGSLLEDRQGHIWVGTLGGGVSRYDGGRFTHLTEKEGLVNEGVMALTEDRRGDLWLGTWGGVSRLRWQRADERGGTAGGVRVRPAGGSARLSVVRHEEWREVL